MQDNWWQADSVVKPTTGGMPAPIIRFPTDPTKARDQQLQEEKAARDADRDVLTTQKDILDIKKKQKEIDDGDVATAVGEERKAAAFLLRALGSNDSYEGTGVGPRSWVGQALADTSPNALNMLPGFIGNSPQRQVADSNQDEFIAASLRQDSGAAIPPEEMERQRRIYFPMPGEGPEAIENKRQARIRAIEGLKQSSGKLLDETLDRYEKIKVSPNNNSKDADDDLKKQYPEASTFVYEGGQLLGYEDKGGEFVLLFDTDKPSVDTGDLPGVPTRTSDGSFMQSVDAGVRGVADVLTLGLADEIAAAGDTLFSGGTMSENLAKQRGTDKFDEENNFGSRLTGQVAAGFLLPTFGARTVAGNAGVAGAYGSGYGFGSSDGSVGDRLSNAAKTGIVSAGIGAGLTGVANRFMKPKGIADDFVDETPMPSPKETFEAGQRIGVTPLPADVGGPTTRLLSAATAATPGGVGSMVKGAEGVQDGLQATRDRVARMFGKAEEAEGAGEAATRGALKFRSDSRDAAGRLYERARNVSKDVKIAPTKAVETLDANLADLAQIPGSTALASTLQGFKEEITKLGDLSVDGVRGMRTVMRDRFMKDGLVGSDTERRINQVIDAAAEDMADGLAKAGNIEAAALFRQADTAWKERAAMMNDVIMPIIGKRGEKSGEQVFKALQAAATGNNSKFTQFMKSLPDAERDTVTASLVDKLGRADDYGGFSLLRFLGDYGKMGKTAKQALFSPQARAQLDDLATMARGSKASQGFLNRSNTGLTLTTGGTAALAFDSMASMGMALGAQFAAGKILTNPTVTKVLSKFARAKSPQAKANILGDLSNVAIRQPAIANDVLLLQEGLLRSLSASPGRAAAQDENNRGQIPPAQ